MYEETIWVKGSRIVVWAIGGIGVVGSFYGSYQLARTVDVWTGATEFAFLTFFISLIASLVGIFLIMASTMIIVDMAADISITKQCNLKILMTLQRSGNLVDSTIDSAPPIVKPLPDETIPDKGSYHIVCINCNKSNPTTNIKCQHCNKLL